LIVTWNVFHGYRMCSYIIQKQRDPSKAHQIKLEVIVKALKWLEIDMDLDEVPFDALICHYYIHGILLDSLSSIFTCRMSVTN
jgi:hypothetical protein